MKWGRKTSSPPSFRGSVITRVFPGTWFSKFKQISGSRDATTTTTSGKKQQRGKLNFSPANSSLPAGRREGRFYGLDNDAYWTLSFRKDRGEGRRRIKPLRYDSEEDFRAAVSSFGTRETRLPGGKLEGIDEMVDTIEIKQGECGKNIAPENVAFRKKKGNRRARLSRKPRSRVQRKRKKKKRSEFGTVFDEGEKESSSVKEEESIPTETEKSDEVKEESQDSVVSHARNHQDLSFQNCNLSYNEEDYEDDGAFADLEENSSNGSSARVSNLKSKNQGESKCLSRRIHSRKNKQKPAKAHAPRSECRIQALEDMKKERTKLKNEVKEPTESSTIYNSFAVVKSSFNPQQDFRDSMVEMIRVKGITRREELQELLACYLTLNCDGHHSLIINAFQQVWFELSGCAY